MEHEGNDNKALRMLKIRRSEFASTALCGASMFLLLYGYFLLRPLREAMGVERSMGDLRILFIATCAVSLLVTLAFGKVVSKSSRTTLIAIGYRAIIACLLVFVVSLLTLPEELKLYSGYVFYVWLSVVNLFLMAVFWGFMADVWSLEQGKRLFASIGVGGTLGALLGSTTAWQLADELGPVAQMLGAAACFELSVRCMKRVHRRDTSASDDARSAPIGGSWIEGARTIVRSPYMMGIGLWIVFMALSSTLLYFTQARLVVDAEEELNARVALFAQLDMWTQLATLLAQLFVTSRLIRWAGVGFTLMILPIVTVIGFTVLAYVSTIDGIEGWQVFAVFAAFNAIHRATRYAVSRPARETLFSVVSREDKYKAKPIVDVFLYRGGDVAGVGVESALAATAVGLWGIAFAAAPLAVMWGALSVALAIRQHRLAENEPQRNDKETAPHAGA